MEDGGPNMGAILSLQRMGSGGAGGMSGSGESLDLSFTSAAAWLGNSIQGGVTQGLAEIIGSSTIFKIISFGLSTIENTGLDKILGLGGLSAANMLNTTGLGLGTILSPTTPIVQLKGKEGQGK